MIAAFSGSLFLFSRAFISSGPHNHLASTNLTKADLFDPTLNLSIATPGVLHHIALPVWDHVGSIKNQNNETSDMPQIFLESGSLGKESAQVTTPSLTRLSRNVNRTFSSRFLSSPRVQLRANRLIHNGVVDKNTEDIYESEVKQLFDPGYDPMQLQPFSSAEESDQIFALRIWLGPKDFSQAKRGKIETCQASGGVKCWLDSHTPHEV